MSATPRLSLPFLSAGQAQKEAYVNQSLQTLDVLVGGCVEEPPRASPPASPAIGACYIVGAGATGEWNGKDKCLAAYTSGGWHFIGPRDGMTVYVRSSGSSSSYRAGSWEQGQIRGSSLILAGEQVVGNRVAAIVSPAGGSTVDTEARSAIDQILTAMRQHGLIES